MPNAESYILEYQASGVCITIFANLRVRVFNGPFFNGLVFNGPFFNGPVLMLLFL